MVDLTEQNIFLLRCLAQRLRLCCQFISLQSELLSLTIELEENLGLAAQDIRFDRLLNEIDCSRLIALKAALSGAASGDKMIGTCRVRSLPRISSAS